MSLLGMTLISTLVLFSLSVFYFVNRTESEAWRGRQREAAQSAAGTVSGFIQRVRDALVIVSIVEPDHLVSDSDEINALLQENTALLEIVRVDSSGHIFASAFQDRSVLASLITIPQSQWFLQARQGKTYIGDVQLSANNVPYLIMAVPSADNGVVAARIQMDVLWDVVRNIHFGKLGQAYVITHNGRIVAHTTPETVLNNMTIQEQPEFATILSAPNNEWSGTYTNFEGKSVVGYTSPVPGTDWLIITELPLTEAFSSTQNAIYVLGAEALLLMSIASFVFARYVRRRIIEPIQQLRDGADRIGQGDLAHRIDLTRKDEVGKLASSFNMMAAELEKQQDNLQKAIAYEYESQRANELARSNAMILALSNLATLLGNSSDSELVLETLGSELRELGIDCGIATLDSAKESVTIKYLSFKSAILQKVEKLTGISAIDHTIPKRYWPDDRVLREKMPVWYSNPGEILRGMFPQVPELIVKKSLQILGFKDKTQLCMLPLMSREQMIGAMLIWGVDIHPSDSTILAVFASQVAFILQNALARENETRRADELDRSNSMILALAKVASRLESSSDTQEIFETIGKELKKIGVDSMIGLLDDNKQSLQVRYVSIKREVISWAEKATGHFLSELSIPRHLWPTEKVINEKIPYWDPNLMKGTLNMFPILPERLHKTALKMAGINLNDPVCYLPLANEQDVLGVLAVWGPGLKHNDVSALSILANQITTAIRNSQLYEIETRRGREKEVLLKEIHHRVKNNLQIISSLLNLQANRVTDSRTLQALSDSQARVRSMALIHERLYQSQSLAKIDFGEYVKSLATDLFRSYRHNITGTQLEIQVDEVILDLDQAVSCGLILNELMTNALKYAFPNGREGTIRVELRVKPERVLSLQVADDGIGVPSDFDTLHTNSLGLQLVNNLVSQLNGTIDIERSEGTSFRISFKY